MFCSTNELKRLALTALLAVPVAGCEAPPETEETLRPVRYTIAEPHDGSRVRFFSGTARAGVASRLSFRVPGTIEQLAVEVGDTVLEGDLIASLDRSDYELQVRQADASLMAAEASARRAANDYKRVQQLYENNNASKSELDGARANAEASAAQYRASEKQLELATRQASYTVLTAPQDGSVSQVPAEVNENVAAGTPIAVLNSSGQTEVYVALPQSIINDVSLNDAVEVRFDPVPGETFSAAINSVGLASDTQGATFPVTVALNEPDDRILPGMAAEVAFRFETETDAGVFRVPAQAVQEDERGHYVFLATGEPGGEASIARREVTVGDLSSDGVAISSGLEPGDYVVTAGAGLMAEGMRVLLPEDPSAL